MKLDVTTQKSNVIYECSHTICNTGELSYKMEVSALKLVMDASAKSDNLQYDMLGCLVVCLIDQAFDGPSVILID